MYYEKLKMGLLEFLGVASERKEINNDNKEILKNFFKKNLLKNISCMSIEDIEDDVENIVNKTWESMDPSVNAALMIKQENNLNHFETNINECKIALQEAMEEIKGEQGVTNNTV